MLLAETAGHIGNRDEGRLIVDAFETAADVGPVQILQHPPARSPLAHDSAEGSVIGPGSAADLAAYPWLHTRQE
jgi:hypothetical protein